jgi:hypothetical protein
MRQLVASLAVLTSVVNLVRAEETDRPQKTETVQFDGQTLELAFEGNDPGATIKEFIPAGEKLDSWTRLAAIREFDNLDDPVAYGVATVEELKKKYPMSPSSLIENPTTGGVIVDFVVWPEDASFAEFNVFRYEKRPGGGIISQQYAQRAYGADSESFLKNLRPVRQRLIDLMAKDGLHVDRSSASTSSAETAEAPELAVP